MSTRTTRCRGSTSPAKLRGVAMSIVGAEAAWRAPGLQAIVATCGDVTLAADPNRWQLCSATAERLAERSDTQLDRKLGIDLARRLGWPDERTDPLLGELVDSR